MFYPCANPSCDFTFESMRAICPDPACLERCMPACGRFYRFEHDGSVTAFSPGAAVPESPNIAWLCCYCATQYEVIGRGQVRLAPDPFAFISRWQIENGEASIAHELG
jgi:hypothetical protein